jgi:DNA helicase-2/ATP-dependent DNA helicase PcrA
MQSSREDNGPAVDIAASFDTEEIEASELAMTIQRLHRLGYRYSEMAVLVRGKVAYPAILEAFEQHKIPVQPGGRTGLFEQADADFLGRCIAWLVDYEWKKGRFNSQKEKITLESLKDLAITVYEIDEAGWKRFSGALAQFRMKVGQDSRTISFIDEIYELLDVLGVRDWDLEDPVRASRLGTIARFQKFIADYESIQMRARSTAEGQVGASDQKKFYFTNLAALMLNYAISDYTDFEGEEDLQSDSVELMTVHAAKGLEWPIVFLPSLTKKRFPSSNSGRSRDWLVPTNLFDTARYEGGDADERRLFYVAMTRAREWLSLSAHQRVSKNTAPVSPYIQEAIGLHNSTLDFPAQWVSNAGDEVPDIYISYSDLAAYLSCGYSYWLKNRIGFPPALVEEIGYGNAVHHLMRVIAEETQRRGKTLGASDIDKILATDFFLPFANKTLAERFKNRARQLVDTYMKDHASDMLRVWETERPFELALPGVVVSGRADVILDKEGGKEERLAIVDYKTEIDDRELGLQLQVYMAAGQREGLDVQGAYLHDLGAATRVAVDTSPEAIANAVQIVVNAADGIRNRDFTASPDKSKCSRCDVRAMCRARIDK